jgi:hypothetical protein
LTRGTRLVDASEVIDQEELRAAFAATADEMPKKFQLTGLTFHGPTAHREWVALAMREGHATAECEAWGDSPFEALDELLRHVREEH